MQSVKFTRSSLYTLIAVGIFGLNSAQAKQTLTYEDVFSLEYPASPQFSSNESGSDTLYYIKRSMDKMTDSTSSQVWQYQARTDSHAPILSQVKGLSSFKVSPAGDRIAYVASAEGGSQLFMYYFASGHSVQLTQLSSSPSSLVWSPDGNKLAFIQRVETKPTSLFTDMPSKPKGANWSEPAKVIDQVNYRADGGGYIAPGYRTPFVIDAAGGIPRQVGEKDIPHGGRLAFSADGKTLYASADFHEKPDLVPFGDDVVAYDLTSGNKSILTQHQGSEFSVLPSPDGEWLAYLFTEDQKLSYQFAEVVIRSQKTGEERRITQDLDRSVQGISWASDSKHIVFSYLDGGKTRLAKARLNGDVIGLPAELSGQSLGRPYTSGEFAVSSQDNIAFTGATPQRPAELEMLSASGKVTPVTNMNTDWSSQKALADVQHVKVKSSVDGRPVDAWMATPPNYDPNKRYPLILEIHGGPHAAYGPHFSMEVQLMAAQGYVVVWSNPRGSSSYGSEFGNLIHHNYPSQDFNDLMDVVDAVVALPYVDSDNLFITGGSGGGVLTAWSIGMTDRFKAAVVAKPVINWLTFALTADAYPYFTQYWMEGMPWEHHDALWKRSPLSLVGNVATPTMLLTGEADYRTPISETEQYYQALKLRNIDSVMV